MRFRIASLIFSTTPNLHLLRSAHSFVRPGFLWADTIFSIHMKCQLHYSNIFKPKLHDSFVHAFGTMGRFHDCDCDEVDQSPLAPIDTSKAFFSSPEGVAYLRSPNHCNSGLVSIHWAFVTGDASCHCRRSLLSRYCVFNFPNIRELHMGHCALENAPYTDNQVFSPWLCSLEFVNCTMMPLLLTFWEGRSFQQTFFPWNTSRRAAFLL